MRNIIQHLAALVAVVMLTGCYIDFREGLQCRTNSDCRGLLCVEGTCKGSGDSSDGSEQGDLVFVSTAIYDGTGYAASGNGDSVLNRNETVRLKITIKNTGDTPFTDVSGTLSTTSASATLDPEHATKTFGTIGGGESSCNGQLRGSWCDSADDPESFRLTVPSSTPDGTVIPMTLSLRDAAGQSQVLSFSLTVTPTGGVLTFVSAALYDRTSYSASGNGDGILNRNETVRLKLSVKNAGSSTLLDVSGTLSTTSAAAVVDSAHATKSFETIGAGESSCNGQLRGSWCDSADDADAFRLTVPNSTANGTTIPMTLTLQDSSGNTWPLTFSLTVKPTGGRLVLSSYATYDGTSYSASGNGDGVPNKGETIRMKISVKNSGSSSLLDVSGTLSTTSNVVTVDPAHSTKSFGSIGAGEFSCNGQLRGSWCDSADDADAFRVTITSTTADDAEIPLKLTLSDSSANEWVVSVSLHVYPTGAVVAAELSISDATSGSPLLTDGDGDSRWEAGETIRMNLSLRNTGASAVTIQSVTLSTTAPGVTILNPQTASYGSIGAHGTVWLNGTSSAKNANLWRLSLAQGRAPETVTFDVTITGAGTTWHDQVSLTTY